ncbi:MAG: hypothetical protein IT169_01690 [Bryobacterales bacterium]|nr:hypothetical protein [Bryobacterales bacterium]
MNKRKLIRQLAREADVSRAEAADAVDELAHRLLQVMRRLEMHASPAPASSARKGKRRADPGATRKEAAGDQSR